MEAVIRKVQGVEEDRSSQWQDLKEPLQMKAWALEEQIKVLSTEVESMTKKVSGLEDHCNQRQDKVTALYKREMIAFYNKHNPAKLQVVDALLAKYKGMEFDIVVQMRDNYKDTLNMEALKADGVYDDSVNADLSLMKLIEQRNQAQTALYELEEQLKRTLLQQENLNKEINFPSALGYLYKSGSDGVWFGSKDYWVDSVRGCVSVECNVDKSVPELKVSVHGTKKGEDCKVAFRVDDCGIVGEKGTKVPSISFPGLYLNVEFTAVIPVQFFVASASSAKKGSTKTDSEIGSWKVRRSGFEIHLNKIERHVGSEVGSTFTTAVLKMILNRVLPGIIRNMIVDIIPKELGWYLVRTAQLQKALLGHVEKIENPIVSFDLVTDIHSLPSRAMAAALDSDITSPPLSPDRDPRLHEALSFLGLTPSQANLLVEIQNSKLFPYPQPLKNAADFLRFYRRFHPDMQKSQRDVDSTWMKGAKKDRKTEEEASKESVEDWIILMEAWQKAVDAYVSQHPNRSSGGVNVRDMFDRIAHLSRKQISLSITARNLNIRGLPMSSLVHTVEDILVRLVNESADAAIEKKRKKGITISKRDEPVTNIKNGFALAHKGMEALIKHMRRVHASVSVRASGDGQVSAQGSNLGVVVSGVGGSIRVSDLLLRTRSNIQFKTFVEGDYYHLILTAIPRADSDQVDQSEPEHLGLGSLAIKNVDASIEIDADELAYAMNEASTANAEPEYPSGDEAETEDERENSPRPSSPKTSPRTSRGNSAVPKIVDGLSIVTDMGNSRRAIIASGSFRPSKKRVNAYSVTGHVKNYSCVRWSSDALLLEANIRNIVEQLEQKKYLQPDSKIAQAGQILAKYLTAHFKIRTHYDVRAQTTPRISTSSIQEILLDVGKATLEHPSETTQEFFSVENQLSLMDAFEDAQKFIDMMDLA